MAKGAHPHFLFPLTNTSQRLLYQFNTLMTLKHSKNTFAATLVSSVGSPDRINMSSLPSFFSLPPPPQTSNKNILHKQIPNYN